MSTSGESENKVGFLRRALAVLLSLLAVVLIVLALVVRTAHNELFTTDRYVQTVTALAETEQLQTDVADAITDGIVDNAGLDSPDVTKGLRMLRIEPDEFKDRMRGIIHKSVLGFVSSETFGTLWADTNRTAHEQFVSLLDSDGPAAPLTVNLGELARAAAKSVSDSGSYIGKVIPLEQLASGAGDTSFELMSPDAVESARTVSGITSTLRWSLLLAAAVFLLFVWLLLGRRMSSARTAAVVLAIGGLVTVVVQRAGANITVSFAEASQEETVRAVYGVATDPLVGYGVTVLVAGLVGVALTFAAPALARGRSAQASGSL